MGDQEHLAACDTRITCHLIANLFSCLRLPLLQSNPVSGSLFQAPQMEAHAVPMTPPPPAANPFNPFCCNGIWASPPEMASVALLCDHIAV